MKKAGEQFQTSKSTEKPNDTKSNIKKNDSDTKKGIKFNINSLLSNYDLKNDEVTNFVLSTKYNNDNNITKITANNDFYVRNDNQANCSIIRNQNMVTNIRKTKRIATIQGVNGNKTCEHIADSDLFGTVCFNPFASENIIYQKFLRVNYNGREDDEGNYNIYLPDEDYPRIFQEVDCYKFLAKHGSAIAIIFQ